MKTKEYMGTFFARKTCYSITDISGTCKNCGEKFFVSRKSILDCMKSWYEKRNEHPSKGVNIHCMGVNCNHDINTPDIILEVLKG
jgi:hypothetical protein